MFRPASPTNTITGPTVVAGITYDSRYEASAISGLVPVLVTGPVPADAAEPELVANALVLNPSEPAVMARTASARGRLQWRSPGLD
jgi:hypothetical protein